MAYPIKAKSDEEWRKHVIESAERRLITGRAKASEKRQMLAAKCLKTTLIILHQDTIPGFRKAVAPLADLPPDVAANVIAGIEQLVRGARGVVMPSEAGDQVKTLNVLPIQGEADALVEAIAAQSSARASRDVKAGRDAADVQQGKSRPAKREAAIAENVVTIKHNGLVEEKV